MSYNHFRQVDIRKVAGNILIKSLKKSVKTWIQKEMWSLLFGGREFWRILLYGPQPRLIAEMCFAFSGSGDEEQPAKTDGGVYNATSLGVEKSFPSSHLDPALLTPSGLSGPHPVSPTMPWCYNWTERLSLHGRRVLFEVLSPCLV